MSVESKSNSSTTTPASDPPSPPSAPNGSRLDGHYPQSTEEITEILAAIRNAANSEERLSAVVRLMEKIG